jgi:hypothetical protein
MAAIATDAHRLLHELLNAVEDARTIRDSADAAMGRGMRDDDLTAITWATERLATAITAAVRVQAELATETARLPQPASK